MPRRKRLAPIGIPQHIVQRGNNRQLCFVSDKDMKAYANWLYEGSIKYGVQIHAWVFMRNHVHLLVTPLEENAPSRLMQLIGRHYVRYFNFTYQRSGTLWEGRFHSCLIESNRYLLNCQKYIELNPVRAGIVRSPADYRWSSYQANGLGINSKLLSPHPIYTQLGKTKFERLARYRELFDENIEGGLLQDIRYSLNKSLVLGTGMFKSEVEELVGYDISPKRLGRPAA